MMAPDRKLPPLVRTGRRDRSGQTGRVYMPDTATMTDARARLGRATSNTFKILFGLAAVIAAGIKNA